MTEGYEKYMSQRKYRTQFANSAFNVECSEQEVNFHHLLDIE
jgi:hypothetical protein